MNIGNNIRELRRRAGQTQEQLAGALNVSFQAVSKWENGTALPDITMIPLLARYFSVTTDALLSYDRDRVMDEVMAIVDRAYEYRVSDPAHSRQILEEGLRQYPGNDILLGNILYTIDLDKRPDEMIVEASRLVDRATDMEIKMDAMQMLAKAHAAKGDLKSAKAVLDQIPELYFTKLELDAELLEGEDSRVSAEKQKWLSFETLIDMLGILSKRAAETGDWERAVRKLEGALAVLEAMAAERQDSSGGPWITPEPLRKAVAVLKPLAGSAKAETAERLEKQVEKHLEQWA